MNANQRATHQVFREQDGWLEAPASPMYCIDDSVPYLGLPLEASDKGFILKWP